MTTWTEAPGGGRARGLRAILRAWVEVTWRPGHFYRVGVAPGDQAPGLTFAMLVVLLEESGRYALDPTSIPGLTSNRFVSAAIAVAVAVLVVTPAALHLIAALQTLPLLALAEERAGISETVQVLAYASAPCVFAGVPLASVRIVAMGYATVLLVIGLETVHGLGRWRAIVAGAIPAALVYGYGFRGFAALVSLLQRWYII